MNVGLALMTSDISLPNYVTYSIPRVHGKGGGIAIYIRESLKDYCSCIQTVCDSVVILKIERNVGKDMYLFVNYIPPINSVYYDNNDIDVFTIIEEHIAQYKDLGDSVAIGDFNSRVGTQLDFIVHDILDKSSLHLLSNVITYASDIDFTRRNSEDKTVNQFGRKLLSLCKSSGLRIVNGRHTGDKNGSITFYNAMALVL